MFRKLEAHMCDETFYTARCQPAKPCNEATRYSAQDHLQDHTKRFATFNTTYQYFDGSREGDCADQLCRGGGLRQRLNPVLSRKDLGTESHSKEGWTDPITSSRNTVSSVRFDPRYSNPLTVSYSKPSASLEMPDCAMRPEDTPLQTFVSPQMLSAGVEDHQETTSAVIEAWQRPLRDQYSQPLGRSRPYSSYQTDCSTVAGTTSGTRVRSTLGEDIGRAAVPGCLTSAVGDNVSSWSGYQDCLQDVAQRGLNEANHMGLAASHVQEHPSQDLWNLGMDGCCGLQNPLETNLALMTEAPNGSDWWKLFDDSQIFLPHTDQEANATGQLPMLGQHNLNMSGMNGNPGLLQRPDPWLSPLSLSSKELTPERGKPRGGLTPCVPTTTFEGMFSSGEGLDTEIASARFGTGTIEAQHRMAPSSLGQESRGLQRRRPSRVQKPRSKSVQRQETEDEFLIRYKDAGLSYKAIKKLGNFDEAESTLRGRYRTLTKQKEQRVRKPEWQQRDIELLFEAVNHFQVSSASSTRPHAPRAVKDHVKESKIPWKQVADWILAKGGSYHFGNATCKKKWVELLN